MKIIKWSYTTPERKGLSWSETWMSKDKGFIKNYEVARNLAIKNPELSEKAKNGELPSLGYKGGTDKQLKIKKKFGALNYVAQWQALREEDLFIETDKEIVITCSKTGIEVIFTNDLEKLNI